jgi:hypothetical protein
MRIEIGQPGEGASFTKDCPNRVRVRPVRPIEADGAKFQVLAGGDLRFRKERILWPEAFLLAQEGDPIDEDLADVLADREEPGRKCLRPLCSYVARVLFDQFVLNVDMLQLEGDDCPIAGARKERERD